MNLFRPKTLVKKISDFHGHKWRLLSSSYGSDSVLLARVYSQSNEY